MNVLLLTKNLKVQKVFIENYIGDIDSTHVVQRNIKSNMLEGDTMVYSTEKKSLTIARYPMSFIGYRFDEIYVDNHLELSDNYLEHLKSNFNFSAKKKIHYFVGG